MFVCICVWMCLFVCVFEREREKERKRETESMCMHSSIGSITSKKYRHPVIS